MQGPAAKHWVSSSGWQIQTDRATELNTRKFWDRVSGFFWVALLLFLHFSTIWVCDGKIQKTTENPEKPRTQKFWDVKRIGLRCFAAWRHSLRVLHHSSWLSPWLTSQLPCSLWSGLTSSRLHCSWVPTWPARTRQGVPSWFLKRLLLWFQFVVSSILDILLARFRNRGLVSIVFLFLWPWLVSGLHLCSCCSELSVAKKQEFCSSPRNKRHIFILRCLGQVAVMLSLFRWLGPWCWTFSLPWVLQPWS